MLAAAAVAAAAANAQVTDCPPNCTGLTSDEIDLIELTLDEQEALYLKVTGPYCDENAFTDPLCMHKRDELRAEALKSDWTPPAFERVGTYCSRFPESCNSSNRLRVNPETRFLVDSFGRTTLLHGVNAIYKVDPYIPSEGEFDP